MFFYSSCRCRSHARLEIHGHHLCHAPICFAGSAQRLVPSHFASRIPMALCPTKDFQGTEITSFTTQVGENAPVLQNQFLQTSIHFLLTCLHPFSAFRASGLPARSHHVRPGMFWKRPGDNPRRPTRSCEDHQLKKPRSCEETRASTDSCGG